jgi:small-conductance mechanosensitive channel
MENIIDINNWPFFIAHQQIIIPVIIITFAFIAGIITEKLILGKIKKILASTGWNGAEIILNSLRGNVFYLIIISGLYAALFQSKINENTVQFFSKFLLVIFILIITKISAKILSGFVSGYVKKYDEFFSSTSIFTNITRLIVFIIGILVILQSLGISITPLLTALGVGGLAAALALQDTLSNLFAGIQIIASGNIRPGDYIKLENGIEGFIADISLRNTIIRQPTNNSVIVPNLKITTAVIVNFSLPEKEYDFFVDITIHNKNDINKAEKIALLAAKETMKKNNPEASSFDPVVLFSEFGPYGTVLKIKLRAKDFNDQGNLKHAYIKLIHAKFKKANISIPDSTLLYVKK